MTKSPSSLGDTNDVYLYVTSGYILGDTDISFSGGADTGTSTGITFIVAGTYTLYASCYGFADTSISIVVSMAATEYLVFTTQPSSAVGTSNCPVVVGAQDIYGNADSTSSYSVTLSLDGTSAVFTSQTVPMVSGVATFSSCSIAGSGTFRFVASATGVTAGSSNSFTVTAQTLKTITLTAPTTTVYPGTSFSVGIAVLDSNGLSFLGSGTTVTLSKSSGTGTLTSTGVTSFIAPTTATATLSQAGAFVLSATCSGSCAGTLTITTASVTVTADAYIEVLWPNHIEENTSNSYTIALVGPTPTANVVVTISSSSVTVTTTTVTLSSTTLSASVSITVPYLGGTGHSVSITITHSFTSTDPNYSAAVYTGCGINSSGVMTMPIYTTTPAITVTNQVAVSSLSSSTYSISINIPPLSQTVTVTPSFSGSNISISPSSVSFTTSSYAAQTITVTSLTAVTSTSLTVTISHSVSSTDTLYSSSSAYTSIPPSLSTVVTVLQSTFSGVTFSNSYLGLAYSEAGTYTMLLNSAPTSSVTVAITLSSSNLSVSPTSLTFTTSNYATAQTVTVTVNTAPTTTTAMFYTVTVIHTLTSTDTNYNSLVYDTTVDVVNTCSPGIYDWTNSATCTATVTNFITSSGSPVPCSTGYYYNSGSCTICPTGSYCPDGVTSYVCGSGYYATTTGNTYCTRSAAGYTSTSTTATPTAVTASSGTYALPGSSAVTACLAADICPQTALNVNQKCSLGSYSAASSTSCTTCIAGNSCTYTSTTACSSTSMYSPLGRPECFYCSGVFTSCSSSAITLVTEGNVLSSNSINSCTSNQVCSIRENYVAFACPPGSYYSSNSCTSCSGAYSCTGAGTSVGTTCTTPNYAWGIVCLTCPYPTYNPSSSCSVIAAGSYLSGSSSATCANYYFSSGGYQTCVFCSPGYKCTASHTSPTSDQCTSDLVCPPLATSTSNCPAGTYNALSGLMDISQCMVCSAGYHCPASTSVSPIASSCASPCVSCVSTEFCPYGSAGTTKIFLCLGGSYSSGTVISTNAECTICTLGYYCQNGASNTPAIGSFSSDLMSRSGCPFGTYGSSTASTDVSACVACTNTNAFCPRQSGLPTLCELGWTNPSSTLTGCSRCSAGTLCAGSSLAASAACQAGYFCPLGTYTVTAFMMTSGFYISITSANSEKDAVECSAGYTCAAGATSLTGACAAGFYCFSGTQMSNFFACPPGTYSTSTSLAAASGCDPCTAGSGCMTGSSAVTACVAGFYCPASSQRSDQFACPGGTYSTSTSLSASSGCTTCETGYYCPIASIYHYACPQGTYRGSTNGIALSDCSTCTVGNYCGSTATVTPTNCEVGYYCNAGATAALTCWSGYYCSSATMSYANMIASYCPAGYLCPTGMSVTPSSTYSCVQGYYCVQSATYVIPCRPGTYGAATGLGSLSACTTTPAGYYLDTYAATTQGTTCPAGYYCPSGTTQAVACPAGTYNSVTGQGDKTDCLICTAGSYCPFEATSTPTACPAGSYCVAGVTSPTFCPVGTYAPSGSLTQESDCTSCGAGSYCDTPGITAVSGSCAAGYYCLLASITATPVGQTYGYLCPAGSYCPAGCTTPTACTAGTFNNYEGQSTSAGCIVCPEGFYCASTISSTPSGPCDPGYFCTTQQTVSNPSAGAATIGHFAPGGTPAEIACSIGTYQDLTAQSSCKTCTAGSYCPTTGMSSPTACTAGFYCPSGTVDPIPCIPGTYRSTTGATSLSDCTACTAGSYCSTYALTAVSGTCGAGYFCQLGSPYEYPSNLVAGAYGPCPAGYWCAAGTTSATQNACVAGTYNPAQLGTSVSSCLKCTAGRYCPGNANTNDNNVCTATYFCPESTSDPTTNPCTAGYYCPAGADYQKPCLSGTFSSSGLQTACTTCTAGYYCPFGSSTITSNICPVGYYCPAGTVYGTQFGCPPGTYNPSTGKTQLSDCLACPAGKYCETYGISDVSARLCAAGFYCSGSAIVSMPMTGSTYGGICQRGQFCPAGSSSPTTCTGGSYCSKSQLSAVSGSCNAGHYCTSGATVPSPVAALFSFGDVCPKGNYCPAGSSTYTACGTGLYLPYTGAQSSAECIQCPPGYYCPVTGITFPTSYVCPAGYYCPLGTTTGTTNECPAGTYCPSGSVQTIQCAAGTYQVTPGSSSCITCTAGNYCELGANSLTTCPAGYYCPSGTGYRYSYPCPIGTFNSATGQTSLANCQSCTAGSYCADAGLSAVSGSCNTGYYCSGGASVPSPSDLSTSGSSCTKGNYCPLGSSSQTTCTAGSYCIQQSLAVVSGQCLAGYYCVTGSVTPVPTDGVSGNICPSGNYCVQGSSAGTVCASGTFAPGTGLKASTDCTACPYGYYCGTSGLSSPTGQCSAAYYCGASSTSITANPCAIGSYCPTGSFESVKCGLGTYQSLSTQSSCVQCTAGNYCTFGYSAGVACPVGYYCPAGTGIDTQYPCAAGYYASTTGLSACVACAPGTVCAAGSTADTTACPLYSYCPSASGYAPLCPGGTYNTGSLSLTSSASCTTCPAGFYCVDGRISDICAAGYLCTGGSPTPTPSDSSGYGSLCPAGYYCPAGTTVAIACPSGTFNKLQGGSAVTDCSGCPPGYYCVPGVSTPFDCPAGGYCPEGIEAPYECPIRTYNALTLQKSENSCLICPGGYLCTAIGVSDYTKYPCNTIGAYCVQGAQTPTPCPPGTYSNSTTAASLETDCIVCPEGYQCPGGSNKVLDCPEGSFCPRGSAYSQLCLIGHYCPKNSRISKLCPVGNYCPKYLYSALPSYVPHSLYYNTTYNGTLYLSCPVGYICPIGSFAPRACADGYYGFNNECFPCAAGTYSNTVQGCGTCAAGYICVSAATKPDPSDLASEGGYVCPAGYYCPQGATSPLPCLPGTYNPDEGMVDGGACMNCTADTYTNEYASAKCYPCGSSASSVEGMTTCNCTGANRSYMMFDGTCRCIPGYQFLSEGQYISDQDGTEDCFPKVVAFAAKGTVRAPDSTPMSPSDCASECDGGSGTRVSGNGLCQCDNVQSVDSACNKNCRDTSDKFTLTGSTITHTQTGNTINLGSTEGVYGDTSCTSACNVYSMNMASGAPAACYGAGDAINGVLKTSGRRLATTAATILNPVICISLNETYIFSVSKTHYPVYSKDSLLNSNPSFDYGAFSGLDSLMQSSTSNITIFIYTFTVQGVYDFLDSSNSNLHMIISVMGSGQQCPDPDVPVKTRTIASLLTLGVKSSTNIISDPDWVFIGTTVLWLFVLALLIILGIYYFENKEWTYRYRLKSDFRAKQTELNVDELSRPEKEDSNDGSDSVEKEKEKEKDIGIEEFLGNDDIDPTIFQSILKALQDQDALAKSTFLHRTEGGEENMKSMLDRLAKLKKFLRDSLEGLNDKGSSRDSDSEAEIEVSPDQEVGKALDDIADNFARDTSRFDDAKKKLLDMLNDPNLSEKDKRDLLADFNANMERIDQALGDEQRKAQEILSKRLADRKAKRGGKKEPQGKSAEAAPSGFMQKLFQPLSGKKPEEIEVDEVKEKQVIKEQIDEEKQDIMKKMREELSSNLKSAKDQREKDALMEKFNSDAKALELRMQEARERQERELAQRLKNRRGRPAAIKEIEIEEDQEDSAVPGFFQEEDQAEIEKIQDRLDEERILLHEQQEAEKVKVLEEIEVVDLPLPKPEERQRLEAALKSSTTEAERKELLNQLNLMDEKLSAGALSQQSQLEAKLLERKRLRAIKEAELKKKHMQEQSRLDDREDQEISKLTDNIARNRMEEVMRSGEDPEEIIRKIKEMMDEKHELELGQLVSKKQEILAERQTYLLQESLTVKSAEIQKARKDFFNKRSLVETSAMHPSLKFSELQNLEKKEAEAMTQIDYNFIQNLSKAQDEMWRGVEDEFRQRFLDLADKHLEETADILQKMRAINPALLEVHLQQAQDEAKLIRTQVEKDYQNKLGELDFRQREIDTMQGEKEKEIEELKRQLDEAENKKREMFEVERMRKEMEQKQKSMIEEMKRRGIRPEEMEEMIKKHEQEMTEWEAAMERERLRQKERTQAKLDARLAKQQDRMAMKIARYKEENMKIVMNKEDDKLELKFNAGRPDLLFEPIKDIESRLRVNPLPIFIRNNITEYADYSTMLQNLLVRVKKIERTVAAVDLDQFEHIMKQLEIISTAVSEIKKN